MSEDRVARPRADPLAYPTPSTAQYVLLLLALLAGGLYIGSWVHNLLLGETWLDGAAECLATWTTTPSALQERRAHATCMAPVEGRRAVFALTGAVVTLAAGIGTMVLIPTVLERRRGLRPLPAALASTRTRAEELARDVGLGRAPELMLGRSTQRDAFSYGYPGRYRIALPPKAALRPTDTSTFDPLVRHELAHVVHHDVALAWLARSVWYTFVPLLLVPVVLSAMREGVWVTVDYVWRAALVLVTVRLVADALLRTREHDADLAAARGGENRRRLQALLAAVGSAAPPAPRRHPAHPAWVRLRAQHPTPARRLDVLDDPTSAVLPSAVQALTAAFLAATAAPLIESTAATGLMGPGGVSVPGVLAAVMSGSLLGVAVGIGMWRAALYTRVTRRPLLPVPVALAVGTGLALGRALSLAQVGTRSGIGVDHPAVLVVPLLVGTGACAVVTGLGLIWADAAPRVPSVRRHWLVALVTSGAVFAAAVRTSETIVDSLDWGGVRFTALALATAEPSWLVLAASATAIAVAGAGFRLRRHATTAPEWAIEEGPALRWPVPARPALPVALLLGGCAGAAGTLAIVAFRLSYGAAATASESQARILGYGLVLVLGAAAAAIVVSLVDGLRGAGASVLAAGCAVVTGAAGLLVTGRVLGAGLYSALFPHLLVKPASVAGMLALLVAGAGLLRPRAAADETPDEGGPGRALRSGATRVVAAFVLTVLLAGPVLGERHRVAAAGSPGTDRQNVLAARAAAREYVATVVLPAVLGFDSAAQAIDAIGIDARLAPAGRAHRIRADVLPRVEALRRLAHGYRAPSPEIDEIHAELVEALTSLSAAASSTAEALERRDPAGLRQSRRAIADAAQARSEWLRRVVALHGS